MMSDRIDEWGSGCHFSCNMRLLFIQTSASIHVKLLKENGCDIDQSGPFDISSMKSCFHGSILYSRVVQLMDV